MSKIVKNVNFERFTAWMHKYGLLVAGVAGFGIGAGITESMIEPKPEIQPTFLEVVDDSKLESRRGTEYFNSPVYNSLTGMGALSEKDVGSLVELIDEPTRQNLMPLMILRATRPDEYSNLSDTLKIGILVDALNESTYFNAWGLPHRYWKVPRTAAAQDPAEVLRDPTLDEPVKAIIELDTAAIEWLTPLLSKKRDAPHWGVSEHAENGQEYRVADYALALIHRIKKKPFPSTQKARDGAIDELLAVTTK